jgi:hypothetical protein
MAVSGGSALSGWVYTAARSSITVALVRRGEAMKTYLGSIVVAAIVLGMTTGAVADQPTDPGKEAAVGKVVRGAGTT